MGDAPMLKSYGAYQVKSLSEVEQREIKQGRCPWCHRQLANIGGTVTCQDCGDWFFGKLTTDH